MMHLLSQSQPLLLPYKLTGIRSADGGNLTEYFASQDDAVTFMLGLPDGIYTVVKLPR